MIDVKMIEFMTDEELMIAAKKHQSAFVDMNHANGVIEEEIGEVTNEMVKLVELYVGEFKGKVNNDIPAMDTLEEMSECVTRLIQEAVQVRAMIRKAMAIAK